MFTNRLAMLGCGLAAVPLLVAASLAAGGAHGQAPAAQGLTFEGQPELGGTISLTLTDDRTGLTRASARNVVVPRCPGDSPTTATLSRDLYYDPPATLTEGEFYVVLPVNLAGMIRATLHVEGRVASDTTVEGTAHWNTWSTTFTCDGPDVPWTATGPVDTSPPPGSLLFAGPTGDAGTLALAVSPDRSTVTQLILGGVALETCTTPDNALDVHALLVPPVEVGEDGSFQASLIVVSGPDARGLFIEGTLTGEATLEGRLTYSDIYSDQCESEVLWSARLAEPPAPEPTATATPTAPAIAPTVISVTPAATSAAATPTTAVAALPAAGGGSPRSEAAPLLAALLGGAAIALAGGYALARLRRS